MTPWQQFKKQAAGRRVSVTRREYDWVFDLGEGLGIGVETLWRLRDASGIILTSDDDGHQFGLPAPIDAEAVANDLLKGSSIVSVIDSEITPDFTILFSDGLAIEVIARSSGYESWQTSFAGTTIIDRSGD